LLSPEIQEELGIAAAEHITKVFGQLDFLVASLEFVFLVLRDAVEEDGVEIDGADVPLLSRFLLRWPRSGGLRTGAE